MVAYFFFLNLILLIDIFLSPLLSRHLGANTWEEHPTHYLQETQVNFNHFLLCS
jgi:hypothetical protein